MSLSKVGMRCCIDTASLHWHTVNMRTPPISPPPDSLIRLLEVAEAGTFSEAARRLGVTRQAVQRSIAALEEQTGAALVDRTTRTMRLTHVGRRLLPHARAIRDALRHTSAVLSASQSTPSGRLRVTAPPLFGETVLARAIPRFLETWPDVDLWVKLTTDRSDPLGGDHDLSIRIGSDPPPDTFAQRLGQARTVLVASPAYLSEHAPITHPDRLSGHRLLAYGTPAQTWTLDQDTTVTIAVTLHLVADSARIVLLAAEAGVGVLHVPHMAAVEALAAGRLVEVLPSWRVTEADVWAIYGHKLAEDATLRALVDVVRDTDW